MNTDKLIRYSLERLYHFSCDTCHKWFSIGDWTETDSIVCPFCGIEHKVVALEKKDD